MDAEKAIRGSQHQRKHESSLRESENREKKSYSDHANVPQFPKPESRFGGQVIGIDIQLKSPPKRWMPQLPAASVVAMSVVFCIFDCSLDESDDELLLADLPAGALVLGIEIVLEPLE